VNWKIVEENIRQFGNRSVKAYLGTINGGGSGHLDDYDNNNNDVKFTLEEAMKAWRGSRGICLLFL
jgi:hypothetical protein